MPFDSLTFDDVSVPVAKPFDFDTATPDERLCELARLLENEQEWRDMMIWDYGVELQTGGICGTSGCAMGLARVTWSGYAAIFQRNIFAEKEAFDLTSKQADFLFGGEAYGGKDSDYITPGMVATAIRQFVANRQSAS